MQTLSTSVVVVTLLALFVGLTNSLVQTGKLFSQYTVPQKYLPFLATIGAFAGGAYVSLSQAGAVNKTTVFFAVVAGLQTLLAGVAPGLVVHAFGGRVHASRPPAMPLKPATTIPAPPPANAA